MPLTEDLVLGCLGAKEEMWPLQRVEALLSHLRLKQATPFLNPARQLPGALCSLCERLTPASRVLSAPGPAPEGHLLCLLPPLCHLSLSDPLSPAPGPGPDLPLLRQVTWSGGGWRAYGAGISSVKPVRAAIPRGSSIQPGARGSPLRPHPHPSF